MIAGLGWRDLLGLRPGLVMDLFFARRAYDDEQHQLRRETDNHDITAEDLAAANEMLKDGGVLG